MANISKFYEKLPKGPAPEIKARGPFERYKARYFGKNPSIAREFVKQILVSDSTDLVLQLSGMSFSQS